MPVCARVRVYLHVSCVWMGAVLCAVLSPVLCSVAPDSWRPMDCSPSGSSVHGDSPGENTGVGYHALLQGIFPTQVRSLGWEDPLEKEMATHSGTLAWKIPWTERLLRAW